MAARDFNQKFIEEMIDLTKDEINADSQNSEANSSIIKIDEPIVTSPQTPKAVHTIASTSSTPQTQTEIFSNFNQATTSTPQKQTEIFSTPKATSSKDSVDKYSKILTPDILQTIRSLGQNKKDVHMVKLEDGTMIKVNFGVLKKKLPVKKKRRRPPPAKVSNGPNEKKKRVRVRKYPVHPLGDGKICTHEQPHSQRGSIFSNKDEFMALIVKCPECKCYHCPLCGQEGNDKVRPRQTLKSITSHVNIRHWDLNVPVVINDKECVSLVCRLHHGKINKKHLHCPCGKVFIKFNLRERFLNHRKTNCPLTKHLHVQSPGIVKRNKSANKQLKPECLVSLFPDDKHRSIFDSLEELLHSVEVCKSCKKYHCIACPTTIFKPSSSSLITKHLKFHYREKTTPHKQEAPFFIPCRLHHGDKYKRHFHCLCGQIIKSTLKTFRGHVKKCQFVNNNYGNRENYTSMQLIPRTTSNQFITSVQVKSMIARNSLPLYGQIGQKIAPPALVTGIFDNLEELCSVIKRCYVCCTRYHCPLCTVTDYPPSSRIKLAKHLLQIHHKFKIKLPSDQLTFPCLIKHGKLIKQHYHCVCGQSYICTKNFNKHIKACEHSKDRILNPALEMERHYFGSGPDIFNKVGTPNVQLDEFGPSSSDDETEPLPLIVAEEANVSTCSTPSKSADHPYCRKEDVWQETLEHHLQAKALAPEDVPIDNINDNTFGLFSDWDDIEENRSKLTDNAQIKQRIINTTQSDAGHGIFNPFDMLVGQIKQCTDEDCCDLYHCPFCPPDEFIPSVFKMTVKHLRIHWSQRLLMIDGTFALPCSFEHGLTLGRHYHCMCGVCVKATPKAFNSHMKSCGFMLGLIAECKQGIQEIHQPLQRKQLVFEDKESQPVDPPKRIRKRPGPKPKAKSSKNAKRSSPVIDDASDTNDSGNGGLSISTVVENVNNTVYGQYDNPFPVQAEPQAAPPPNIVIDAVQHDGHSYDIVLSADGDFDLDQLKSLLPEGSNIIVMKE